MGDKNVWANRNTAKCSLFKKIWKETFCVILWEKVKKWVY